LESWLYPRLYELEDRHWWFRGRRAVIRALLDRGRVGPGYRLLDAGCGTGRNLADLAVRAASAHGVDSATEAVAFCRRRGLHGVSQAELDALPFDAAAFDLLVATDVVEHLDDDAGALRELRRVAAPGACLLVTVPAYQWLWSEHDDAHQHKRRYTRPQLLERVRAAGWEPAVATYFNSLLLPPIAAARRLARTSAESDYDRTPGPLNALLERPMRLEAQLIRRGASLPAGVSIGLVARAA
jgi:SAM-dependent methyltransferase